MTIDSRTIERAASSSSMLARLGDALGELEVHLGVDQAAQRRVADALGERLPCFGRLRCLIGDVEDRA